MPLESAIARSGKGWNLWLILDIVTIHAADQQIARHEQGLALTCPILGPASKGHQKSTLLWQTGIATL